jgi:hypothetical protein
MRIVLFLIGALLAVGAGCNNVTPTNNSDTAATSSAQNTTSSSVKFFVSEGGTVLKIQTSKTAFKEIFAKNIPVFDRDYDDQRSVAARDYVFDYASQPEIGGYDAPQYDAKHGLVYFFVLNQTTAGMVSGSRALFVYHLDSGALELLIKREGTDSFGDVSLSADGRYIVFSDGVHDGVCGSVRGLTVFDTVTKKEISKLFIPKDRIGSIEFVKWVTNAQFEYQEEMLRGGVACSSAQDTDWTINKKKFDIPQKQ